MKTFQQGTLGNIATIVMGQSPSGDSCNGEGVGAPLLNGPTEFGPRHPLPVQYTSNPKRYSRKGDLLFCVRGSTTGRMNWADREYAIGRGIAALRHKADPTLNPFIKAVMDNYLAAMLAQATGSTFPNLSKDQICSQPISIPPEAIQGLIASVFSAYDDLTERTEKRIKTLEEMAQLLYTEWFVKFKFPGHEKTELVESGTQYGLVPKGWNVVDMRSVAKIVDCLHTKKPQDIKTGTKILLQLNNILDNGMINIEKVFSIRDDDYRKGTKNIELREGDCVVTNVGRIAASAQVPKGMVAAAGRNMTVIRPQKIPTSYLIQYLHSRHMEREVSGKTDAGAIMGSLNVKNIYLLKILRPEQSVLHLFSKLTSGLRDEMNALHHQYRVLCRIRDLLIPQLVTGIRILKS